MRYLSVRERALRAYATALGEITEANGYNTTVNAVRRLRTIVDRDDSPPVIHMVIGKTQVSQRSTEGKLVRIPVVLLFFARAVNESPDTEYNLFLCDIQRRLANGIIDTTCSPSKEIPIETSMEDEPFYFEANEGDIVGAIETAITVSWCNKDPRKWSAEDTLVAA